ncbi:carbonyl reductase [NADPH] 1-like [Centruroides sculpturatus]|uniref:carbonyl reductase [NADPH] 1-like n=1 Tax=Centruroides sculpturatus TaxID=218467 RepID=UPI000C6E90B9|nr:carbonyl reductase [NADPH] 1-like [Centruroides sculpturatus]
MSTKVAVVTGGNKGIGFAIVKALCQKFDGHVYLTARDEQRGKDAVNKLEKLGLKPKFHLLNISNLESIRQLRDYLKETYDGLDVLVNNAGIAYKMASTVPFHEQAENTIAVNFFDTLNVCNELFPILRPHSRVVNISSVYGMLSKVGNEDIQKKFSSPYLTKEELCVLMRKFVQDIKDGVHEKNGWSNSTYCVSKVGVSALTFIQQREFDEDSRPDLVVNAVHPGIVDTDMTSHKGELTPEQGAEAPVYLALLPPNVEKPRGQFVWNDKTIVDWKQLAPL